MMGRGNKYNWRCGDCFESSVYEISSDAEAEEKGYLYADPDNLDSTGFNNITIFPNVDTSWCVHKVQVDICARPGPPKVESVDLIGGSVQMDSEGEETVRIRGTNLGPNLYNVFYGLNSTGGRGYRMNDCELSDPVTFTEVTCKTISGTGGPMHFVVNANIKRRLARG